ncbi:cationic trypsin-like isoform X1 [Drosophila hydei]|uniref:trypsin n=1 Tax=Drosophila hydei TaxID=7224 RepID=A0A6J1LGI2_DROHY|nr:cationic trypsin-like isoform X1 [Drosophila hydei]XP_023165369.2 cationic trypsin-like isoform X1 [Drosophila hydei]XP_023165370.2 cationic trypsin-like isoform X1 [Drosophila hydei]
MLMPLSAILTIHTILLCQLTLADIGNETRIINGFDCDIEEVPYQVSLRRLRQERYRRGSGHFCGGSILSRRVIVTAAHCLKGERPRGVVVVIGNRYLNERSSTMKELRVSKWRSHYNYRRVKNDIALILTAGEMHPVHGAVAYLPINRGWERPGTTCLVSGWGQTDKVTSRPSIKLRAAFVPIIRADTCYMLYNIPGTVCAGYTTTTGPSFGDSGGPLRCGNKLTGIVSVGRAAGGPSAYSSMRYHANWINKQSNSLYNGILSLRSFCIQREVILAFIIYVTSSY